MRMSFMFRSTATIASAVIFPVLAVAGEANPPGISTSISRSATIPTEGMPPGSEMWAIWIALPAGKRIEVHEAKVSSTWMDLEMGLTGSAVSAPVSGKLAENQCMILATEGPVPFTGQETTLGTGEGFACHFGTGIPYWEENRGHEPYARAQLNVGGPWAPGMYDTVDAYRSAGGESRALRVDPISFRKVEKELRAAGMMIATTRVVTMAPGSMNVALDRYPTLRMVISGELKWGALPADTEAAAIPQSLFKLGVFNWIEWTRPQKVVLSNESGAAAEFVEWSVMPAVATAP